MVSDTVIYRNTIFNIAINYKSNHYSILIDVICYNRDLKAMIPVGEFNIQEQKAPSI